MPLIRGHDAAAAEVPSEVRARDGQASEEGRYDDGEARHGQSNVDVEAGAAFARLHPYPDDDGFALVVPRS